MHRTTLIIYVSALALIAILLTDDPGVRVIAAGLLLVWAPLVHWIISIERAQVARLLETIQDLCVTVSPVPSRDAFDQD